MTASDVVTATVRIKAAPEVVFPYFTDPALMIEWIGQFADLSPDPGGVFALDFEGIAVRGTYVAIEPPHRVVFTWGIPGNDALPPGASTVEVLLRADGDDTVVELFHRGLPESERPRHRGWNERLADLAAAVAA